MGDVPVCVPVKVEKQDSRPYGLLEINDIWGIRSARARTPQHQSPNHSRRAASCRHHRDLKTLSDDVRGNELIYQKREHMEYIVFGKWLLSETDRLGRYGVYPIKLIDMLRVLEPATVKQKIEAYESELASERAAAWTAAERALAEEAAEQTAE